MDEVSAEEYCKLFFPVLFFHLFQRINIPRIQYQRLLTDHICSYSESESNVRIMQVIGGANTDVINLVFSSLQLFHMAVKTFEFGKKNQRQENNYPLHQHCQICQRQPTVYFRCLLLPSCVVERYSLQRLLVRNFSLFS